MKKSIILLFGIFVFVISGNISRSVATEKESLDHFLLVPEKDPALNIEDWMIKGIYWDAYVNVPKLIIEEKDQDLELEDWMIRE